MIKTVGVINTYYIYNLQKNESKKKKRAEAR